MSARNLVGMRQMTRQMGARQPRRLSWLVALMLLPTLAVAAPTERHEWRTLRHDISNSRFTPGKGKLGTPVTRWRVKIGGRARQVVIADSDLDGRDDVLALEAGAIAARTWDGDVLWKTASHGFTWISAIADVDGDGTQELVARTARDVRVLALTSGKEMWRSPVGAFDRLTFVAVVDLDGDGAAEIALANDGGFNEGVTGDTSVYGFSGGVKLRYVTPKKGPYGWPIHAAGQRLVDVNSDGILDFVNVAGDGKGSAWVHAASGKDGKFLAKTAKIKGLGCDRSRELDAGLFACLTTDKKSSAAAGVQAVKFKDGALVLAWSWAPAGSDHVTWLGRWDLDKDGLQEVLMFVRDVGLVALDAKTGKALGKPQWPAPLGSVTADVNATLVAGDTPLLVMRRLVAGEDAGGASFVFTWSRKLGLTQRGELGDGVLRTLPGLEQGANVVWLYDTDKDGLLDRGQTGKLTFAQQKLNFATVGEVIYDPLGGGMPVRLKDGQVYRLGLRTWDGRLEVRTAVGKLLNDADGDGKANLSFGGNTVPHVRIGWLAKGDEVPHIAVGLPGRLLLLKSPTGKLGQKPNLVEVMRAGNTQMLGVPLDTDGDGDRELVVRHRRVGHAVSVRALKLDKNGKWQTKWGWEPDNKLLRGSNRMGPVLAITDADGDGGEDLLLGMTTKKNWAKGGLRLLDGATGAMSWNPDAKAAHFDSSAHAMIQIPTKDGPQILQSRYIYRRRYDLKTGALVTVGGASAKEPRYGIPKLVTHKGQSAVLVTAGASGMGLEQGPDHDPVWLVKGVDWQYQPSAVFPLEGTSHFATLRRGSAVVEVRNVATGKLLWSQVYGGGKAVAKDEGVAVMADLVALGDLTGDGIPALLFTSSRGRLYAVNAKDGSVRWAMNFGGTVGMPIVADVDGDGKVEIVVATPDGYLEALDGNQLGSVGWVRENDGKGPALTEDADIDEQERSDELHANWQALKGAAGYAVQLRTAAGAVVLPWADVGAKPSVHLTGLHLQLGQTYHVAVRAFGTVDGATSYSTVTLSDGVKLVDGAGPKITHIAVLPSALPTAHEGALIEVHAEDTTRLAEVACEVRLLSDVHGRVVRKLATRKVELKLPWDGHAPNGGSLAPPGKYVVRCTVRDFGGHTASAETNLVICPPERTAKDGTCEAPIKRGPGPEATDPSLFGEEVDNGCGCAVRGPRSGALNFGSLLLLAACATLLLRRRRT
ncbi:MAG: VCBS repeat-containing protein [Myxococcales bacterium]|nr:VCBS repeat-containing protein [Myxococcales bacterium]